jgi:pimeloyl-ACP methyl ester carboxylesterase
MTVLEQMRHFSQQYGKAIEIDGKRWRYYRLGEGAPLLWLTGGLRRAAQGFGFMERLAAHRTVIAPDYPPVMTIAEFNTAFDAILAAEGVEAFTLGGQSYGGMLAQAYLAHRGAAVQQLVLSSTGPADFGKAWLPVEYLVIGLIRLLPERTIKGLMLRELLKIVSAPAAEQAEWEAVVRSVMANELTRADMISHFTAAADLIRHSDTLRAALRAWSGRVVVLSAENDPTQSLQDFPRYERLFGRPVERVSMGSMGHTAALFDPDAFAALLEKALS